MMPTEESQRSGSRFPRGGIGYIFGFAMVFTSSVRGSDYLVHTIRHDDHPAVQRDHDADGGLALFDLTVGALTLAGTRLYARRRKDDVGPQRQDIPKRY